MEGVQGETVTGTDRAHLDFYLGLRTGWARMAGALVDTYQRRAADWESEHGHAPADAAEISDAISTHPQFRYAMYLQRRTQFLMKWGVHGTHAYIEGQRDELEKQINDGIEDGYLRGSHSTLRLAPDLEMPAYYADVDFHVEKGGYWRDDLDAPAYDFGSKIHWAGMENMAEVHEWKTSALTRDDYSRVLDVACGSGDSTFGMVRGFPSARVDAIDIAAPMVKWAFRKSEAKGLGADYSQQDAEHMTFEDGTFDLVTATMLFHELPPAANAQVFAEMFRVCAPGGDLAIYTASVPPSPYGQFMADWHAHVNVEPYMPDFFRTDLEQAARDAGFQDVSTRVVYPEPTEGSGGRRARAGGWRLVSGRKA